MYTCIHVYIIHRERDIDMCERAVVSYSGETGDHPGLRERRAPARTGPAAAAFRRFTPSLPTKIVPTKICRLNISRKSSVDLGIPPLRIKILLESNPLKSRILVRRLAVRCLLVRFNHRDFSGAL